MKLGFGYMRDHYPFYFRVCLKFFWYKVKGKDWRKNTGVGQSIRKTFVEHKLEFRSVRRYQTIMRCSLVSCSRQLLRLKNKQETEDINHRRLHCIQWRLKPIKSRINSPSSIILRWFYTFLPSERLVWSVSENRLIKLILWG